MMIREKMSEVEKDLADMESLFREHGIAHFSAREVCSMRRADNAIAIPPEKYWTRIIPALQLAEELRRLVGPLSVGNGYRPRDYNKAVRGSRRSQHIQFRALDLDLVLRGLENQVNFYEAACEIFLSRGKELKIGLGLYRHNHGTRIHIDTGYSYRHWKKKYTQPLLERLR